MSTSTPLQALAAPRRQEILRLVWDRERSAGEIAGSFDVSFAAISQHLAQLREAGVVNVRREGRHRYYSARREGLGPLADYFEAMWRSGLDRLKQMAETEERRAGQPEQERSR